MWTIDLTNNVIWSRQAYCHLYCVATALNFYFIDALSVKMNFRRKITKQAITYPKITNQDKLRLIQISAVLVVHPDLLLKKIRPGRLTGRHLRMINEHIALYWYFSTFTNHWPQWLKWKIWGEGTPFSVRQHGHPSHEGRAHQMLMWVNIRRHICLYFSQYVLVCY